MIHLTLLLPLAVGGIASALWREHRQKKKFVILTPDFPEVRLSQNEQDSTKSISKRVLVVDDAAEISHSQRVSLIALALSASGTLVFPILVLASIPLLSYALFYFLSSIGRSTVKRKKSAFTLFELASIAGASITGRYLMLSSLLAFSFSIRKWALQAGNISSIGVSKAFDPKYRNVWVLRDGTEVEINLSQIQSDDIVVLHEGDIVSLNGEVVKGEGMIKQFALTGARQVVPKQVGDPVFSFTEVAAGDLYIKYH